MTFDQFVASKRWSNNIGAELRDECLQGMSGYIYADSYWIAAHELETYYVMIERSEYVSEDLGALEKRLWIDFAADEINAG